MKILKANELAASKLTCLIYGVPGMGKTTLLGTLPGNTLILDVDRGTRVIADCENVDVVEISDDLHEVNEVLQMLEKSKKYQNVAVDSLSELERGLLAYYGRMGNNDGLPGMQDYGRANAKIIDLCRILRGLAVNVFFTAWKFCIFRFFNFLQL